MSNLGWERAREREALRSQIGSLTRSVTCAAPAEDTAQILEAIVNMLEEIDGRLSGLEEREP